MKTNKPEGGNESQATKQTQILNIMLSGLAGSGKTHFAADLIHSVTSLGRISGTTSTTSMSKPATGVSHQAMDGSSEAHRSKSGELSSAYPSQSQSKKMDARGSRKATALDSGTELASDAQSVYLQCNKYAHSLDLHPHFIARFCFA